MNDKLKEFFEKVKRPPVWAQIVSYILTLFSIAGALLILLVDYEGGFLSVIAYTLFGVSALLLSYSVYLSVLLFPKVKRKLVAWACKYEFTYRLLKNFGFRTVIFTIVSLLMSIAFGLFNGVMGIVYLSIWYGALSAYYICLVCMRGGILMYHKRKIGRRKNQAENEALRQAKTYRNCGVLLLILNVTLSSAIAQMIFDDQAFDYAGWTIYAYAAYAFYKITMSIINLFKARKQDDLTVQAIRNINLADAAVSLLALQTALLHTFATEGVNTSLFNTLTGLAVSIAAYFIAVRMIVVGCKRIRTMKLENTNERKSI